METPLTTDGPLIMAGKSIRAEAFAGAIESSNDFAAKLTHRYNCHNQLVEALAKIQAQITVNYPLGSPTTNAINAIIDNALTLAQSQP